MTTALLLRFVSVVSLLLAAGHTLGAQSSWSPPGETAVLNSMRTFQFDVFGVTRSYFDFYRGFGFVLSVFFTLQAVVLWQLATIAKTNARAVRPIIASFAVASVASAVLTWEFIFPVPAVFLIPIVGALGLAWFVGQPRNST
jgi:hypothetical protein